MASVWVCAHAANIEVKNYTELKSAVSKATAGDSIFLHAGTYKITSQISISKNSGTADKMIFLGGYPGEAYPLLDCSASYAFYMQADYWHFKDLEIVHATHNGIRLEGSDHGIYENLRIHDNKNTGLQIDRGSSYNIIKNCDSYHNIDARNEDADGFAPKLEVGTDNYFYGCRSWENSDDGYDGYMRGDDRQITTYYDHCIAYRNGYIENANGNGDGNGFKLGGYDAGSPRCHNFMVNNCISANNLHKGYDRNSNVGSITIYNSSAFNNGTTSKDFNFAYPAGKRSTQNDGHTLTMKNCVSYSKDGRDYQMSCTPYVEDHNTWDSSISGCSLDDFVSVDTLELMAARNADGSLPDMAFMNLKQGSKLIDAGTDVGLSFSGSAPDLGWKEYVSTTGIASVAKENVTITRRDGVLSISCDKQFPQVSVYDLSGKLIASHTGYADHIAIDAPRTGVCLVRVVIDGKSYGYKVR